MNDERGQSTVEFALLIPLLAIFLLLVINVGVVVRENLLVANASRAAARELAVNSDVSNATRLVQQSTSDARVDISRPAEPGKYLRVTVTKSVDNGVPLMNIMLPTITVSSTTSMRVEK